MAHTHSPKQNITPRYKPHLCNTLAVHSIFFARTHSNRHTIQVVFIAQLSTPDERASFDTTVLRHGVIVSYRITTLCVALYISSAHLDVPRLCSCTAVTGSKGSIDRALD